LSAARPAGLAGLALLLLSLAPRAAAQILPDRPVVWLGGRMVIGGSVSIAAASSEDDTNFNAGSYGEDTMRLISAAFTSSVSLHPRVGMEVDLRVAGEPDGSSWYFRPHTLALKLQPFGTPAFSVAAGFLQTAFGTTNGRTYGRDNLLIGRPLIYQYATALRGDAIPRHVPELLENRGRGAEAYYLVGDYFAYGDDPNYGQYAGLPLADANGWNAGVRVAAGGDWLNAAVTVTEGSLSNPRSRGASGGWQASGRVETRRVTGLILGASAAYGLYLDRDLDSVLPLAVANQEPRETAFGLDAEYSRDYWLVRAEAVHSRRTVPALREPLLADVMSVTGLDFEGRYRLAPGLYVAARIGSLLFGPAGQDAGGESWDADAFRIEVGPGWSVTRGLLLKATYQYNRRDVTGSLRSAHRVAAEAMAWF
jgi:hypothetical protein